MPDVTKLVLTHLGALRGKYGGAGLVLVREAVRDLAAADSRRGIRTRLVALDDGRTARALQLPPVADAADHAGAKAYVDAAAARWSPDYLLLLGSPDVVPMQPLTNLLWTGDPRRGDPDESVPSDLPYACAAPHSADPGDFRGATRVVGRLPDGTGSGDPGQLLTVLAVATGYRSRRRADYLPPFALTAAEWLGSTTQTLQRLLGDTAALQAVPPAAPPWPATQTRRRLHLMNLHGGPADPQYYGQRGRSFPVALAAADLARGRNLLEGTVGAAESCYGGMLYDPAEAGGVPGFTDVYLAAGGYGYCASTNTAYGPADSNDAADLVCRAFLQHVLAGGSLGRAMLQARQDYVFTKATLSPTDLKTLAQFTLYGDPSVHPVARAQPAAAPAADAGPPAGLAARRRRLQANGEALQSTTTRAAATPREVTAGERRRLADSVAARLPAPGRGPRVALADAQLRTFDVVPAPAAGPGPGERFHVFLDRRPSGLRAVVAREEDGRIEQVALLLER